MGATIVDENTLSWGQYYDTGMKESNEEMIRVGQITTWTGICLLFVGIILAVIGYLLKDKMRPQSQQSPKYCMNCGRAIPFNARMCSYCGKQFEGMK